MTLTPEDVQNKRFTTVRFKEGYDEEEVDGFLDEVEAELRRLLGENDQLRRAPKPAAPPAPVAPAAPAPRGPPPPPSRSCCPRGAAAGGRAAYVAAGAAHGRRGDRRGEGGGRADERVREGGSRPDRFLRAHEGSRPGGGGAAAACGRRGRSPAPAQCAGGPDRLAARVRARVPHQAEGLPRRAAPRAGVTAVGGAGSASVAIRVLGCCAAPGGLVGTATSRPPARRRAGPRAAALDVEPVQPGAAAARRGRRHRERCADRTPARARRGRALRRPRRPPGLSPRRCPRPP